jgi:hypothetical protein
MITQHPDARSYLLKIVFFHELLRIYQRQVRSHVVLICKHGKVETAPNAC